MYIGAYAGKVAVKDDHYSGALQFVLGYPSATINLDQVIYLRLMCTMKIIKTKTRAAPVWHKNQRR